MKMLRYRLYGIIDVPPDAPSEVTDVLDKMKEYGDGTIVGVELLEGEPSLPDLDTDFALHHKPVKKPKKADK